MYNSHNYLFVSDFHLGAGLDRRTGLISPREDFLHDDTFAQFLAYHAGLQVVATINEPDHYCACPWILVINGDLFEFMQIVEKPAEGAELQQVRDTTDCGDLSWRERRYGLGTRPRECAWKLERIYQGHLLFFQALAWFAAHDNYGLVILKGNHDVELYWPLVQQRFRELLVRAYKIWKNAADEDCGRKSPLPVHEGLPDELSLQDLEAGVRFPPSFCYEEGLFYAEHGGQYQSTGLGTCFPDFENPTLPDEDDMDDPIGKGLIRLPSGSLFVRYVFNRAETYHPFAENLKPILRYPLWLIQKLPKGAVYILFWHLPFGSLLKSFKGFKDWVRRLRDKEGKPYVSPGQDGCSNPEMSPQFCTKLPEIQEQVRSLLRKDALKAKLLIALDALVSIAGLFVGLVAFLAVLEDFFEDMYLSEYLLTALQLVLILAFLWIVKRCGSFLFNKADEVFETPFLEEAAGKIDEFLCSEEGGPGGVPYYLFGHNHTPYIQRLDSGMGDTAGGESRWYINTGSWLPEFDRDNPFRETYKLTYFCLMPGGPGMGTGTPRLLEWQPEAGRPRIARIYNKNIRLIWKSETRCPEQPESP